MDTRSLAFERKLSLVTSASHPIPSIRSRPFPSIPFTTTQALVALEACYWSIIQGAAATQQPGAAGRQAKVKQNRKACSPTPPNRFPGCML